MNQLNSILEEFDKKRESKKGSNWNEKAIAECFLPCAKKILLGGYFLVNKKYIIDLGAIELYYHEEEGNIKDYIMYHIPERYSSPKSSVIMMEKEQGTNLPYFEFGSFNLHQSGVDVTFENPIKKYRASFLIRSYRVLKLKDEDNVNDLTIPFDKCSTHIFDDMFYQAISFENTKIEWIKCNKEGNVDSCPRRNTKTRVLEKDKRTGKSKIVTTDEQDLRPWQFIREGIIEK